MPARLRIVLTEEEERTLSDLKEAQSVPYRTRDRAHMLRLKSYAHFRCMEGKEGRAYPAG